MSKDLSFQAEYESADREQKRLWIILNRISGALCDAADVTLGDETTYEQSIRELTRKRDEWKAKAEQEKSWNEKRCRDFAISTGTSDSKWNELVEFWQKKAQATEHLGDTCGTLRTANMELLAENAQLRRRIERLEREVTAKTIAKRIVDIRFAKYRAGHWYSALQPGLKELWLAEAKRIERLLLKEISA